MELFHDQRMAAKYQIINISEGYPSTDSTYLFEGNKIEIEEEPQDGKTFLNPWDNKIGIVDIFIKVNGNVIEKLNSHPVRIEEEGLNRYFGEIAYLKVKDLKNKNTKLFTVVKKTVELTKEKSNGDIVGWVPDEQLKYKSFAIDENGSIEEEAFVFTERDALQTELLNAGTLGPYRVGYYTDLWEAYPTIFFPLLYPLVTLMTGFIFSIVFFPYKKLKKKRLP